MHAQARKGGWKAATQLGCGGLDLVAAEQSTLEQKQEQVRVEVALVHLPTGPLHIPDAMVTAKAACAPSAHEWTIRTDACASAHATLCSAPQRKPAGGGDAMVRCAVWRESGRWVGRPAALATGAPRRR